MSNMGLHDPFGNLKHKLWPKEGLGVKLAIWLPTTKSRESPWFPCMQVVCNILLESSWQGLQLFFRPHFNWRFTEKFMGPKITRVPTLGISGLPLGSPRTKCHLGAGHVTGHKVYYKGKGGGFPQVRAVVSLMSSSLPMVRPNTRSVPTMH
jgi:hypothetical protein